MPQNYRNQEREAALIRKLHETEQQLQITETALDWAIDRATLPLLHCTTQWKDDSTSEDCVEFYLVNRSILIIRQWQGDTRPVSLIVTPVDKFLRDWQYREDHGIESTWHRTCAEVKRKLEARYAASA